MAARRKAAGGRSFTGLGRVGPLLFGLALAAVVAGCASIDAEQGAPQAMAQGPAQALSAQEWRVFELDGAAIPADGPAPTIAFGAGRLSGSGGCNRYMGQYRLGEHASIRTGELASTMMACPDAVMATEDRFLKLLAEAQTFELQGGVLTLRSDEGKIIRARHGRTPQREAP